MTNEEAIVQLEIDATNLVGRLASEPVHDTSFSELWKRKLEAIDIAIYAIKMFDKHEAECERCACNLLSERDALKEEKLISNADVAELTARAEAAEAERDRAIKQMCRFCKSLDKKAGIKPVCAADCEWRGPQEAVEGVTENG